MQNINTWLRESAQESARELVHINEKELFHRNIAGFGMREKVIDVLGELRAALFPSLFESSETKKEYIEVHVTEHLNRAAIGLGEIIRQILENKCEKVDRVNCDHCSDAAERLTVLFMEKLPMIRQMLSYDIEAAYIGDPAARFIDEILLSYPSIEAVSIYRIAHELFVLGIPVIPRVMTEYAHQLTGIDIHPGATIGSHFFIDHGTGVVIGEPCVIGSHVKLYQGVTLGAKSFELDSDGNPVKGIKRHPNIEDDVVIYAGATILGGDTTVGKGSVIGGNVWLVKSVAPYSMVYNATPEPHIR